MCSSTHLKGNKGVWFPAGYESWWSRAPKSPEYPWAGLGWGPLLPGTVTARAVLPAPCSVWPRGFQLPAGPGETSLCLAPSSHGGQIISTRQLDAAMLGRCCRVRVGNGTHFDRAVKPPATGRASADLWVFGLAHICPCWDSWSSVPSVGCWMLERLGAGSSPVLPKCRHPAVSSAKCQGVCVLEIASNRPWSSMHKPSES